MITLEQIRLLESKITRAIDLIRVLKDENGTLRKGLESAQKRMKELETLVDGFKTDQHEIESVIVRSLHTLDQLEESAAARRPDRPAPTAAVSAAAATAAVRPEPSPPRPRSSSPDAAATGDGLDQRAPAEEHAPRAAKEELDIF
jgi:hypothetical protein